MKKSTRNAALGVMLGLAAIAPAMADSSVVASNSSAATEKAREKVIAEVKSKIQAAPSDVLEIVKTYVSAHKGMAGEIVKAAIEAAQADVSTVLAIVDAAVSVAPEQVATIGHYAAAVAPDAAPGIVAIVSNVATAGDAKSGLGAKDAVASALGGDDDSVASALGGANDWNSSWNPLDFPTGGVSDPAVGPAPGSSPGGFPLLPPGTPINNPPAVNPPSTETGFEG
jgi:hypothetical protein